MGLQNASALLEAEAQLILTDVNQKLLIDGKKELSKLYKKEMIHVYEMNVTDKENIRNVARSLEENGIRVDILINNAAIDPKVKDDNLIKESSRLEEFDLDQWNLQVNVGLTGAFLCSQVFGSAMAKDGKGGVILNIASDLSVISPDQRLYSKRH